MTSRTHTPEDIKKIDDEFKAVLSTNFFKEKKEWVGLTDEEYEEMAEQYVTNCYFDTLEYAKNIEAKLKDKNNG